MKKFIINFILRFKLLWNKKLLLAYVNKNLNSKINVEMLEEATDKVDKKVEIENKSKNLNQPSTNKTKMDAADKKKLIFKIVGFLLIAGVIAGILFGIFYQGPGQFNVDSVTGDTSTSTFTLKDRNNQTRIVSKSSSASFSYFGSSPNIIQVTIGGGFGFYFTMTKSVEADSVVAFIANLKINLSTGEVFTITTDTTTTPTKPVQVLTKDAVLTDTFGYFLKGSFNNTSLPASSVNVLSLIINLLPIIILIIFGVLMYKSFKGQSQGQDGILSIGKSQAKLAQSTVKFSDVAGIEEEKSELIEIVDYLKRPERYAAMGARSPKGVILYGPPGTGKTLLARAVAGEANVPFFQVSGSAFEDMLVGVGAKRVRDLFAKAIKAAPAIIFIDEIDSVGSKRGKLETTSGSLADQTLNQLLAEMDGFSSRTGVVIIAATNRLDVLDDALLRPGRFDRHIQVNLPDIKERTAILKIHSRNKNLSSSVDLEDIARRTPGFSGAQLENVLNEATLLAVRNNKTSISMTDLDEAIDRVIGGPAKRTKVISLDEKKQIAYHEAGHAIVGLYTKGSDVVQKITIIPRGQAAGYTLSVPEVQELSIQKKSDLLGLVAGALGGRASEELIYGKESISTGAANDLYKVTNIVKAMVTQLGMSELGMTQFVPSEGQSNVYQSRFYSDKTAELIDKEIETIINKQYVVATTIIKNNRKELDLIVETLLLLETIVKPQIDYIHKNKMLPKEALDRKKEIEKKSLEKGIEKESNKISEDEQQIEKLKTKDESKKDVNEKISSLKKDEINDKEKKDNLQKELEDKKKKS